MRRGTVQILRSAHTAERWETRAGRGETLLESMAKNVEVGLSTSFQGSEANCDHTLHVGLFLKLL